MANRNDRDKSPITSSFVSIESKLKKYLMRFLVRPEDIEDTVQEAFVRAFEAEKNGDVKFPKAFLFKVAKHIALNELSRKSSRLTITIGEIGGLDVIGSKTLLEQKLEVAQFLDSLSVVVGSLPPQCQKVLIMRKVYGFSHKEIAGRLAVSVKTVEKHLTKALLRCNQGIKSLQKGGEADEVPYTEINEERNIIFAAREE